MDSWYLLKPEIFFKILILDWKILKKFRNSKIFETDDGAFRPSKVLCCENWFKDANILFIILFILTKLF